MVADYLGFRTVYDILGQEGLEMRWSPELRSKTPEEVRVLRRVAIIPRITNWTPRRFESY